MRQLGKEGLRVLECCWLCWDLAEFSGLQLPPKRSNSLVLAEQFCRLPQAMFIN